MKSFHLWLSRPIWVALLTLFLASLGVRGRAELVCLSAISASITFIWTLRKIARMDKGITYPTKNEAVAFERLIYICMSFAWIDHFLGVLLPMLIWIPFSISHTTSVHLTGDLELDLSLMAFIQHIVTILYQAGVIKFLKNLFGHHFDEFV